MMTIQRPNDAASELLWHAPGGPFPINAQLVVGANEHVVASLDGVVLGVVPPGSHWLHPQPFPFLANAIVGGTQIRAELWFVRTSMMAGFKFGGPLGSMIDAVSGESCDPRVMGEYSLVVENPIAVVTACMGASWSDATALLGWVNANVLKHVKEIVGELVMVEGIGVLGPEIPKRLAAALPPAMGELGSMGLAFGGVHEVTLVFSPADNETLRAAYGAKAAEKKAAVQPQIAAPASIACSGCRTMHAGGRFCRACGQPLPVA